MEQSRMLKVKRNSTSRNLDSKSKKRKSCRYCSTKEGEGEAAAEEVSSK
jgi:hypothetical protein